MTTKSKDKFIIYLEIDGVLVSMLNLKQRDVTDGKHIFTRLSVESLNNIINLFDVEICIISTWGRKYKGVSESEIEEFKDFFKNRGIIVNNLTIGDCDKRAEYVISQRDKGYDRYLIIDVECHEYYDRLGRGKDEIPYNRIINVNSWRGLDNNDFISVLRNFNRLNSNEY